MKVGLVIVAVLLFSGCNIFELKDAENPDGTGSVDPLNLERIILIAGEQFRTKIYEEMFSEDFVFESSIYPTRHTKEKLLAAFEHLRPKVSYIEWREGITVNDGNQISLTGVDYKVYYKGELHYTGKADFRLVKGLEWKIRYWKDYPDDENKPFFIF